MTRVLAVRLLCALLALSAIAGAVLPPLALAVPRGQLPPERYFAQTGYWVANDAFWDYFRHRGAVDAFGYPVSRQFTLLGFPVQIFQRALMQQQPDGSVRLMNLLDPGLMPFTQINFSHFPAPDEAIKAATPKVGQPDYDQRILDYVRATAPDAFSGQPVNFARTFFGTVTCDQAFPGAECQEALLPLLDLEIWGAPISAPQVEPNNPNFVYQRFQRGIMHFDAGCRCTRGILLADYFKSILTGQNLPADLAQQAAGSRFFGQYSPGQPNAVARPSELPATNLTDAFTPESPDVANLPALPQSAPTRSPAYGASIFALGRPDAADILGRVTGLGFSWQKSLIPWREVEHEGKGVFDWSATDPLMKESDDKDVQVLARVDFSPAWAAATLANNSPPANNQDFADFLKALVTRYKTGSKRGHIDAIEVWNEPNLAREWGDLPVDRAQARAYVQLLCVAYGAIKQADPNVTVVSAGLSPTGWNDQTARPDDVYLQWMYDAGLRDCSDALGAHAPGYKAPPEVSPAEAAANPAWGGDRSFTFRRVEDLRAIMEHNGDANKQVWVTEFGWTSDPVHPAYAWHKVTEEQSADYLVRAFRWAIQHWRPWIGPMFVWNIPDPAWGPEDEMYWWGITNADGSPRPAYLALRAARQDGTLP